MLKTRLVMTACAILFMADAPASDTLTQVALEQQVVDAERAFANTMAQRDFAGFVSFLADEAIFFSGMTPLRGKQMVADSWKPYYEQVEAPFSWEPEIVQVLDSGTLALSSGPVFNPEGKRIATFNSIWRLEANGQWRIVFDKGSAACNCETP
ncbi:MAG: nuclear transport factor 2 family protein [Lysobacterales bacterium]